MDKIIKRDTLEPVAIEIKDDYARYHFEIVCHKTGKHICKFDVYEKDLPTRKTLTEKLDEPPKKRPRPKMSVGMGGPGDLS